MKLVYFNDFRLGVLRGDSVVDVTPVVQKIPHTGPGAALLTDKTRAVGQTSG